MGNKTRNKGAQVVVIILVAAVLAVLLWFVGIPLYKQLSPSRERADLSAYLSLSGPEAAAVMLGEKRAPADALVRDGTVYWDADSVISNFSDKFWYNADEGILLYTTADEVVRAVAGELSYTRHAEAAPGVGVTPETVQTDTPVFLIDGGKAYIALDYAKQFSNFTYKLYYEPYRVQIYAENGSFESVGVIKNTALRAGPDIKSDVVRDLSKGDSVFVLDRMDGWIEVRTVDAFIGYVETKRLSADSTDVAIEIPQDYAPPPYTDLTEDKRICLAWHQVSVAGANAYLNDMIANAWPLDVISPTWYSISDGSGAVKSLAWKSYVDSAHARGLKVWPLVDDFTTGLDRNTLLMSTASRNAFVSYMIEQAQELGFDGINLDFEVVPVEAASGFEQLMRELSVACRAHGLVFSIDNYPPRSHTEHYNRALQGEIADYVIIMGYDEHWSASSGAGSVASLPFVRDAIEQTLAAVPARKVINAVPFYTRIWSTAEDGTVKVESTIGQKTEADWVAKRNLVPVWDDELGQYYTEVTENNKLYQLWMEDGRSMQTRIDAMKEYGLGGVACWRLGLEGDGNSIWNILGGYTRG